MMKKNGVLKKTIMTLSKQNIDNMEMLETINEEKESKQGDSP
jgi:hypothetical protein